MHAAFGCGSILLWSPVALRYVIYFRFEDDVVISFTILSVVMLLYTKIGWRTLKLQQAKGVPFWDMVYAYKQYTNILRE